MTPFDRQVRAAVYDLLVGGARRVDAGTLAAARDWGSGEVTAALRRLAEQHRIALDRNEAVWMAHPFSGVPTSYRAVIDDRMWYANCAWDSLAILALVGDGHAEGPDGPLWTVSDGRVDPDGVVHLVVPVRHFWEDIGFT